MRRALFAILLLVVSSLVAVVVSSLAASRPALAASTTPPCSWAGESDQRDVNIGAPDLDAFYWLSALPTAQGGDAVITGSYPQARYFSFHVYDDEGNALDSIYDAQIDPDAGSSNPFRGPTPKGAGDDYTLTVRYEAKPARPAPNTIYADPTAAGQPAPALLVYRVYVPQNPAQPSGNVAFPQITLESSSGATLLAEGACSTTPPPFGSVLWQGVADTNWPSDVPTTSVAGATSPPTWARSFGNMLGNQQNAYLTTNVSRQLGQIVVIHARAPTFPDTGSGVPPYAPQQLRYWSYCTYDATEQAVIGCAADYDAAIRDGWVTYVVSDPDDRPANATTANGVTWLPWGGINDGAQIVYRNMLPSSSFHYAAQSIAQGQSAAAVMGPYYPTAAYCATSTFEKGGVAACLPPPTDATSTAPPPTQAPVAQCHARSLHGAHGTLPTGTLIASARTAVARGRGELELSVTHAARVYVDVGARQLAVLHARACRTYRVALPRGHADVRVSATVRGARERRTLRHPIA